MSLRDLCTRGVETLESIEVQVCGVLGDKAP
jgi:hypothetical protein